MEVKEVSIEELEHPEYNPRTIDDKAFKALKNSIKEYGLVQKPIWNEQTGHIVGGNQRVKAVRSMGWDKVTVNVVDLSEEDEKALNVALNNEGMQGDFTAEVSNIIDEIKEEDVAKYDELRMFEVEPDEDIEDDIDMEVQGEADSVEEDRGSEHPDMKLQPYEHYDYVFMVADDVRDWNWLCDFLELEKVNASPVGKEKVGLMRGMWVEDLKDKIRENADMIDGIKRVEEDEE